MIEFGVLVEKVIRYSVDGILIMCCFISAMIFAIFSICILKDTIKNLKEREYKSAIIGMWITIVCAIISFMIAQCTTVLAISLCR